MPNRRAAPRVVAVDRDVRDHRGAGEQFGSTPFAQVDQGLVWNRASDYDTTTTDAGYGQGAWSTPRVAMWPPTSA